MTVFAIVIGMATAFMVGCTVKALRQLQENARLQDELAEALVKMILQRREEI